MQHLHIIERKGRLPGTILFLHGSSSSSRVFEPVMNTEKLPYNLISFDLPGHGRSYRSDNMEVYGFENYKKIILDVLSDVKGDVLLVGSSLGGHLAIEVAPFVSSLKGLVIFGTPPVKRPLNIEEAFLPNPILQYYFSEDVTEGQLDEAMKEAVKIQEVTPLLRKDFRGCDPRIRTAIAKDIAGGSFADEAKIFEQLTVPRYVFHGSHDPTVSLSYVRDLCNRSEGIAEVVLIENCGHYASLEHPGLFIEKLAEIAIENLK